MEIMSEKLRGLNLNEEDFSGDILLKNKARVVN
jgi:hypothetical protein